MRTLVAVSLLCVAPCSVVAQGYRVRLDTRINAVSWRGLTADSIASSVAVPGPSGGFTTPDGHAATCADAWCHFFRTGPVQRGMPLSADADVTAWGLGVRGLRLHARVRYARDIGEAAWPGTQPSLQLLEGFAEWQRHDVTVQGGRTLAFSGLGVIGLDGVRATWRPGGGAFDVSAHAGWGLARGSALPVTSPALNPLDDFQPRDRQVVAGAEAGYRHRVFDARIEYRREVDPAVDHLVSERAAASIEAVPIGGVTLRARATYDLAFGHVGTSDAVLSWRHRHAGLSGGVRRYRPFFDLWTIWGAFSPAAYTAWHGSADVSPHRAVTLRVRGERYRFDETGTSTPLVAAEDEGWRTETGAAWEPRTGLILSAAHHAEFGPGAASHGVEGRMSWAPLERVTVGAHASRQKRPLEFRYSDATVTITGAEAEWRGDRVRVGVGALRVAEERARPDAAALDWGQWRVQARVTITHGTDPDPFRLPRARRPSS